MGPVQQGSIVLVTHRESVGSNGGSAVTAGSRSYQWARSGILKLWVQQSSPLIGWSPHHLELVDEAVKAWLACRDVRVTIVSWSVDADVRLYWTDRLPPTNPGVTMLYSNAVGRLTHADVFIAVEPAPWNTGTPDRVLFATIAHELGHALGLPHDPSPAALMHSSPLVTSVTALDLKRLEALIHQP